MVAGDEPDGLTGRRLRRQDVHIIEIWQLRHLGHIWICNFSRSVNVLSKSSSEQVSGERNRLQTRFREVIAQGDRTCIITYKEYGRRDDPFGGLTAAHIYPVARIEDGYRQGYYGQITDTCPETEIGTSRMYSLQNGLLFADTMHHLWDEFNLVLTLMRRLASA
ncbi:hypothetical protein B7463_g12278, partial [Scytalidium lignicola]